MHPRTFFFGLIIATAILTLPAVTSNAVWEAEWLTSEFMDTPGSTPHDARCEEIYGVGHSCVEWCDIYQGPTIVPRGQYCCENNGDELCTKPLY